MSVPYQATLQQCTGDISYFYELSDQLQHELLKFSTKKTIQNGSILMYENDEVENIYFLCSGMLKVYKVNHLYQETFLYHLTPGTVISELTDFTDDAVHCFCNIKALEESTVFVIKKKNLMEFCQLHPELSHLLLKAFSHKSKLMQCLVRRELFYDSTIFQRMKRQEKANMLNVQPATLSRILKKFEGQNIIKRDARVISVLNDDELLKVQSGLVGK